MKEKLIRLRDLAWELARESMESGNSAVYGDLIDLVPKLTKHINEPAERVNGVGRQVAQRGHIRVFAKYRREDYEAEFDPSRMSGTRGRCVKYNGEWLAASKAAMEITDGSAVNGWLFWKYRSDDGFDRSIDDFRNQE